MFTQNMDMQTQGVKFYAKIIFTKYLYPETKACNMQKC